MKFDVDDPVQALSVEMLRASELGRQIDAAFDARNTDNLTRAIFFRFQARAAEALAAMVFVDLEAVDALKQIRILQNEVKRYDEIFADLKKIAEDGKAAEQKLDEEERDDIIEALSATPDGQIELMRMGLLQEPTDD